MMSFREKSAWVTFLCFLAATVAYFYTLWQVMGGTVDADTLFPRFGVLLGAMVAVEIGAHLVLAFQSPREARTPKDERERLIALKATRLAYFILLVGGFASIGTIHMRANAFVIAHVLLGVIAIAEVARFGTAIVLFRRDA